MSKPGTISSKRAKLSGAEYEIATAIAEPAAKPITRRRIVLASLCGTALLAALATMPLRDTATSASQVAAAKPAPAIRATHPTIDAWAQVRPQVRPGQVRTEDTTGSIAKKKKKSGKTKYMKAAEEPNPIGDWFKKTFGADDKAARKRTSAID